MKQFSMFKIFSPDDEKLKIIATHIKNKKFNLDDAYRDYNTIWNIIFPQFFIQGNMFFEAGDFQGILGLANIVPTRSASVMMKIWDKKVWGATIVRQTRGLLKYIMGELQLRRLETSSPDPIVVRMCTMVGFKEEGIKIRSFKWNGKFYDDTYMAILKEEV